jgi:RNA polymerase sigma factor (sigma-70 family)|tara:strand:- start:1231 stop:1740 length:510 start_codon:yes stop_codon:yes gene_type:complete
MSPGQQAMIESNLGVIRKVVLRYVRHWMLIDDSWQYGVACHGVCEAVAAGRWTPSRGKFSTFVTTVANNAILDEWRLRKRRDEQLPVDSLGAEDVEIPDDSKMVLDVPYEQVFNNGFGPEMKQDVDMFRRHIEGESITDIVKDLGISRQSFYNRTKRVKAVLLKHVVQI